MNTTRFVALCVTGALFGAGCGADSPEAAGPGPQPAKEAVLAAFDRYDAVGGFSASHGNQEVDDFLLDLVRDPRLPGKVDDIAIECGNARYQRTLDDYVAGRKVPITVVRKVWRNATSPNCGFSTFYEQLVPLVRAVNRRLPRSQRLRVLACDPPVDWRRVRRPRDMKPFLDRDASIARVIEHESLAKGRTVLLLFGFRHLQHGIGMGSAVDRYEAHGYQGRTYVISDHRGFANGAPLGRNNDALEARMESWPSPSISPIAGTWLGELDSAYFNEPGSKGYPGVDAYLYVGPRDTLLREPRSAQALLDDRYFAELRRRNAATGERGGPMDPASILRDERRAGALSYQRGAG